LRDDAECGLVSLRQVAASLYVHENHDAHGVPSNGPVVALGGGLLLVDTARTNLHSDCAPCTSGAPTGAPELLLDGLEAYRSGSSESMNR
jgi:hypothetical protein